MPIDTDKEKTIKNLQGIKPSLLPEKMIETFGDTAVPDNWNYINLLEMESIQPRYKSLPYLS